MRIAILLLLLAPTSREWECVPWHELIARAKLIVAGEVVDFGKDRENRRTAILRVDLVLKGECDDPKITLPFKTDETWGCDFKIEYEKRKYLLLIDDQRYFRLIYYPDHAQTEIASLDSPQVFEIAEKVVEKYPKISLEAPTLRGRYKVVATYEYDRAKYVSDCAKFCPGHAKPEASWNRCAERTLRAEAEFVIEQRKPSFTDGSSDGSHSSSRTGSGATSSQGSWRAIPSRTGVPPRG